MGNESLDTRNRKQPSIKRLSHNGCNASDEGPSGAQWISVNFLKFCECVCVSVWEKGSVASLVGGARYHRWLENRSQSPAGPRKILILL